jgi:heat shock protein HslJ
MRIARIGTGLILALFCICLYAEMPAQKITVTGKLTRVMAIGGESTGWAIQLDSEATIDGKQVNSIEVDSRKTKRLEKLENKHVEATGVRFVGPAEVRGNAIKLGPLASSRMMCPEAVMNQEMKYLNALQAAERFEWKDPYLLIYCKGFEKPLRFTRMTPSTPAGF